VVPFRTIDDDLRRVYYRQGYRFIGRLFHSAVKICRWTKESLRSRRVCFKELWYPPVESHRCLQMTPYMGCNHRCLYCWRLHPGDRPGLSWIDLPLSPDELEEPSKIVDEAIKKRKELLIGFKGNPRIDEKRFFEALKPTMMTMSLSGEPTLYPDLSGLIIEASKRGMITFLVTNGTMPEALENLSPLPFQLYVSLSAPDRKTFAMVSRPIIEDSWERLNRTIDILPSLKTRRVLRITVLRNINTKNIQGYASFVKRAEPDFVEVKAYEWVGESQRRLPRDAMPFMEDIRALAMELSNLTGYEVKGEFEPSGVVLLG
ncbi:4-demethylwyosine synthase TYW1, partial [Candidatus Bathyarchaeota archaeon]|nr:4-demethylwyosine synthase TYW1 [Candidatus Bathyarchaeota archaeon]